jgi:UDP-N-acetyl-2-amino-2-deoxyglucuronate dehydrogenase
MYQFAIIGCGEAAKTHIPQIILHGHLAAVHDIIPEKAAALASSFPECKQYQSVEELLANHHIQAVVVCTPNGLHAEHCIKALQAGKHVFCESPFCLTLAAAWQMIETQKFCRRNLFIADVITGNRALRDLKSELETELGSQSYSFELHLEHSSLIKVKDWQLELFPGGGAIYAHFSPFIELLNFLFGEVSSIKGVDNSGIAGDEEGKALLEMKTGVIGQISWSLQTSGQKKTGLTIRSSRKTWNFSMEELYSYTQRNMEALYSAFIISMEKKYTDSLFQSLQTVKTMEKLYHPVPQTIAD